jgi:hypothetical protein
MGIDTASAKFLCAARSRGADFARALMLGRQTFYPDARSLRRIFAIHKLPHDVDAFLRQNEYAESFFRCLGAREVASLDCSSYEGATLVHDMNSPIPDELRERFTVVHDGGTLEHVFNLPQALRNSMEMVRVGGHFTQVTVANNFMGHGFWQFSPELVFRVFSPANGYRIDAVLLHEVVPGGPWYVVTDPNEVGARVELCNSRPTYILTIAQRIARTEIFAIPPQQSDYVAQWRDGDEPPPARTCGGAPNPPPSDARPPRRRRRFRLAITRALQHVPQAVVGRTSSSSQRAFDRPYYRRIAEDALLRGDLR